ncbi:MAG: KOW domain-containing RNA-binding protein [Ezakiella sp.]|nr:KOW domain-containing RNA-binding protein [Ezakiella sp.]MDY3947593.1 KOW domain-containing RNA-binding protein [Ezakiella sp.]
MIDKIVSGQIVRSKAGRDKFRYFVIYEVLDDDYVTIVDGDLRKVDRPKKKKIRHLSFLNDNAFDTEFSFTNKNLRSLLKGYDNRGIGHLCQRRTQ